MQNLCCYIQVTSSICWNPSKSSHDWLVGFIPRISFIFNVSDISAISDLTDGGYFAALSASDSGYDLRVWARPNPDAAGSTFDIAITTLCLSTRS